MKCDCGNCPLDQSQYGCHLIDEECEQFQKLVELSWGRYADSFLSKVTDKPRSTEVN